MSLEASDSVSVPVDTTKATSSDTKLYSSPSQGSEREKRFEIDEIFFSRTDKRGVIQSGNDVFFRVSGYPEEDLIGAPHKIVRHRDMPKATFQLMWDTIKTEKPFVAYVKNRDAEGAHYWVLAFMTAIDDGYLSVRIKPTSGYLDKIKPEYSKLQKEEHEQNLNPSQSVDLLLDRLRGLGYANYTTFIVQAAAAEIVARDEALGLPQDRQLSDMASILAHIKNIAEACSHLFDESRNVEALPMNLQVRSKRLGASAGPIGVIASDCSDRIRELRNQMIDFGEACEATVEKACKVTLFHCVARVQREIATVASEQNAQGNGAIEDADLKELKRQAQNFDEKSFAGAEDMQEMKAQIERFGRAIRVLEKTIVGLNVNRIMCGIESVILGEHAGAITDIVSDLDQFQSKVPQYCKEIEQNLRSLQGCMTSAKQYALSA